MFPTHVGMNRVNLAIQRERVNVPHTRGDEPYRDLTHNERLDMFPTHVGMNRMDDGLEGSRF